MSLRDFLADLGPILWLRIRFGGGKPPAPRVEIGAYQPPEDDIEARLRRAEGTRED